MSTCWSPGQPDGDCPNFGLCCFDGCANTCGEGDHDDDDDSGDDDDDALDQNIKAVIKKSYICVYNFTEKILNFLTHIVNVPYSRVHSPKAPTAGEAATTNNH